MNRLMRDSFGRAAKSRGTKGAGSTGDRQNEINNGRKKDRRDVACYSEPVCQVPSVLDLHHVRRGGNIHVVSKTGKSANRTMQGSFPSDRLDIPFVT